MIPVRLAAHCAFAVALACTPAFGQKQPPPKKTAAPKPKLPPLQFSELLEFVERLSTVAPDRLIEGVRQRCVGFAATPEQTEKLKSLGATDELLSWIPKAPPPPPLPTPAFAGPLSVTCNQPECSVLVNGQDRGRTAKGILEIKGLRPEDTYVEVRRDGYLSKLEKVTLQPDRPASVAFTLLPDPQVSRRAGVELFMKMLHRLGGLSGGSRSAGLTAKGQMTIASKAGKPVDRPVLVEIALPETFKLSTVNSSNKRQCSVTYQPANQNVQFTCDNKKSPDSALKSELEHAARMLASHYLPTLVDGLLASQFEAWGPSSGATEPPVLLRVSANKEAYQFQLGKDFLPVWIGHTGTDNTTWTVEFASYQDRYSFPLKVSIRNEDKTNIIDFSFNPVDLKK